MKSSVELIGMAALVLLVCVSANTQELPKNAPTKEQLANDNKLFMTVANKALKWDEPAEPVKIVGPLYFVGTQGLSSWLFTTPQGHILLNTGTPKSGPMIAESIRKLRFKPEDIRIIINGHGHSGRGSDARLSPTLKLAWFQARCQYAVVQMAAYKLDVHRA